MARLVINDKLGTSSDYSIPEFPPEAMQKINARIKTFENTFYFSYTTGDRNLTRSKFREAMHEPEKTSEMLLGFDGDMLQNLKLRGTIDKVKGTGKKPSTLFDRVGAFIKGAINPIHIWNKAYLGNFTDYQPKNSSTIY